MFYISYSQVEYDTISAKMFEILFEGSNRERNCRKHKKEFIKSNDIIKQRKAKPNLRKVKNDSTNHIQSIKKE